MKSIALTIKIHIPVIYHKHPFSEIKLIEEFVDYRQTEKHVRNLAYNKLLPFFKSVQKMGDMFGERFKTGISVPGISLKLLEKHAPFIIDELKVIVDKGIAEFHAEPWSQSVLTYYIENELISQTNLHRKTIHSLFGQNPTVFIAHAALNPENFLNFTPFTGCRTLFTSADYIYKSRSRCIKHESGNPKRAHFLINHTLSKKFQHIVSDDLPDRESFSIDSFYRYIRKHVSLVKPLVLIFDPLAKNFSSFGKWEEAVNLLMNKAGVAFYSLTDLEEIANYFSIDNDYSDDMLMNFMQQDNWMRNKMQQEAFRQFKNINREINLGGQLYLPEAWYYLQDLNNYFHMSDSFFLDNFSRMNFTPFRSPHEAFTSYMNAASNFWNVKENNPKFGLKSIFPIAPAIN